LKSAERVIKAGRLVIVSFVIFVELQMLDQIFVINFMVQIIWLQKCATLILARDGLSLHRIVF